MTSSRNRFLMWLMVLVTLLATVSLIAGIRNAWQHPMDLRLRYQTARLMLAGENPYRVQAADDLSARARQALGGNVRDFEPDYLPSAMLPMLPLSVLPWNVAKFVWLLVNLASAVSLVLLARRWAGPAGIPQSLFWLAVALWVGGTPFRNSLGIGQNTVFALVLTLAAFLLQERNRPILAGVLLALGLFKYAYIGLVVLFFIVLHHRWKTLLFAGMIHLLAHLMLCLRMNANPVSIIADVFQYNSRIFDRETTLTIWLPFRALAARFPEWNLPADALGAGVLAVMLAALLVVWQRRGLSPYEHAWAFVLCMLATLVVTCRNYHLTFTFFGWLWIFSPAASVSGARMPRFLMAGAIIYLSFIHRLLEAIVSRMDVDSIWLLRGFNGGLLLMCVSSLLLFWCTVWANPAAEATTPSQG